MNYKLIVHYIDILGKEFDLESTWLNVTKRQAIRYCKEHYATELGTFKEEIQILEVIQL